MKGIKQKRLNKGITQVELGEKLGVSQATIAMWETGKRTPRTKLLKNLAETLECTIDELLKG